jgi:hypothetical protein
VCGMGDLISEAGLEPTDMAVLMLSRFSQKNRTVRRYISEIFSGTLTYHRKSNRCKGSAGGQ